MKVFISSLIILAAIQCSKAGPLRLQKRAAFYIANETACVVDNTVYSNGDPIPTDDPCESCKCRPPGFACVLKDCQAKPGCRAVRRVGHCCPDYICGCEHNGRMYRDGDEIRDSKNPCYTCHCQGSSIACAFVDCFFRVDCPPEYIAGECCPHYSSCNETVNNSLNEKNPYLNENEPSFETLAPSSSIVPGVTYVDETTPPPPAVDTTVVVFDTETIKTESVEEIQPELVNIYAVDADEPSDFVEEPVGIVKEPSNIIVGPSNIVEELSDLSEKPLEENENPSDIVEELSDISKEPSDIIEDPSDEAKDQSDSADGTLILIKETDFVEELQDDSPQEMNIHLITLIAPEQTMTPELPIDDSSETEIVYNHKELLDETTQEPKTTTISEASSLSKLDSAVADKTENHSPEDSHVHPPTENIDVEPEEPSNTLEAGGLPSDYGKSLRFPEENGTINHTETKTTLTQEYKTESSKETEIFTESSILVETHTPTEIASTEKSEPVEISSDSTNKNLYYNPKDNLQTDLVETVTTTVKIGDHQTDSTVEDKVETVSTTTFQTGHLFKSETEKLKLNDSEKISTISESTVSNLASEINANGFTEKDITTAKILEKIISTTIDSITSTADVTETTTIIH